MELQEILQAIQEGKIVCFEKSYNTLSISDSGLFTVTDTRTGMQKGMSSLDFDNCFIKGV